MLAYRHAFHAGNHADVLKHVVLVAVLRHMNLKDKGWRLVDTHAGAGGYSLRSDYARSRAEWEDGVGRLWARADLPPAVADYMALVRAFNTDGQLVQVPGSPALAQTLRRAQDQLRLYELHPTDHRILASYVDDTPGVETKMSDGFEALRSTLPPPTRRGVLLIDPSYEIKTDYGRVVAALREALERFADGTVVIWMPQLQLLEAVKLPQRLQAVADAQAKRGWLLAGLTLARADARGFGMLGSSVFVANPPHTLQATLKPALPWLAQVLAQVEGATHQFKQGRGAA